MAVYIFHNSTKTSKLKIYRLHLLTVNALTGSGLAHQWRASQSILQGNNPNDILCSWFQTCNQIQQIQSKKLNKTNKYSLLCCFQRQSVF